MTFPTVQANTSGHDGAPRQRMKLNSDSTVHFPLNTKLNEMLEKFSDTQVGNPILHKVVPKEFFDCHGLLHIILSKDDGSPVILYNHRGHTETPKSFIPMRMQWERNPKNDLLSIQVLIGGQDGYQLVEDLQEAGVSLAFVTPCFSDTVNYDWPKRAKYLSTLHLIQTNTDMNCIVFTEYDLVSFPLSSLLLDTRGIREDGKRGSRLTAWFTALRDAGLKPNVLHTDKDFAGA
ncbi:hypothetical protein V1523DRAFT_398805 [Lipomyces doorenjongii]